MTLRVVIVNRELGVYLGHCIGLGFWSRLDAAGQNSAVTFCGFDDAADYMKTWATPVPQCELATVETQDIWATVGELKAAGLSGYIGGMGL